MSMYHQLEGSAFNYYGCWSVLRKSQKWNDDLSKDASKAKRKAQQQEQRRLAATTTTITTTTTTARSAVPSVPSVPVERTSREREARPVGRKQAERARHDDKDNDVQEILKRQEASNKYDEDLLREMKRQNDIAEQMLELKKKQIEMMMKQFAQNE